MPSTYRNIGHPIRGSFVVRDPADVQAFRALYPGRADRLRGAKC